MIYELRTYTLQPGKQPEYLKLNAEVGRKIRGDKYGKFEAGKLGGWLTLAKGVLRSREKYSRNVCYWQTEAGQLNEAVHLWVYKDLNERAAARAKALGDPDWQAFLGKALPLLMSMQSAVLIPTTVSPMK